MKSVHESDIKPGFKRFSVSDELTLKSKKQGNDWSELDEDWGFHLFDIPEEFRTEKKKENFLLAIKEEEEKKLVLDSLPYHIDIEPTNICNLHCPLCSTGIDAKTRKKGMLTFEKFKKLIDEVKETVLQISLQNWGESTLNKDLPNMIKYAHDSGIFLRMSTNFSVNYEESYFENLITSGLGRLVIDLDGTTQEVYEKYRVNGSLELVLKNVRKAIEIKRKYHLKYPIIQVKMLVMAQNEHQIKDFLELSKKLGADEIELGNIQMNPNTAKKWLPKNKEFVYETYLNKERNVPCHWPWSGLIINWEGGVAPCAIVDDQNSDFGNVFDDGIQKIWNNEYYISARSEFSTEKKMTKDTICNTCKNDTHNPKLLRVGDTFSLTMNKQMIKIN